MPCYCKILVILIGDREKAPQPMSDYRDRFRGVPTDRLPPSKAVIGPSTIRGDDRAHGYGTTHQENFTGQWQLPSAPVDPVCLHILISLVIEYDFISFYWSAKPTESHCIQ